MLSSFVWGFVAVVGLAWFGFGFSGLFFNLFVWLVFEMRPFIVVQTGLKLLMLPKADFKLSHPLASPL